MEQVEEERKKTLKVSLIEPIEKNLLVKYILFVWAKQNSIIVDRLGWSSNFVSLKMHVTEEYTRNLSF